jgi:WXG100 family type VII secretion target
MANIKVTPEEVRTLGKKCNTESGTVDGVLNAIKTQISATNWDSPAANRFKQDWEGKFQPALKELSKSLLELGKAANTMATNYDNTEASYGGS